MKISINSIKLQTIYFQIDKYLNTHPDISNLLSDLDLHPFLESFIQQSYHIIPLQYIPLTLSNTSPIPYTCLSSHIRYHLDYLNLLDTVFHNFNNSQPQHPTSTVPLLLSTYIAFYYTLLSTHFPKYFT